MTSTSLLARSSTIALLAPALALAAIAACGGRQTAMTTAPHAGVAALPDMRSAPGRPPVVVIAREGDPAVAIAIAVTTAGLSGGSHAVSDEPEIATGLSALVESRLRARAIDARVTASWDGLRAAALAGSPQEASLLTDALRDALVAPATAADLAAVRHKLGLLAKRPLRDRALARWARCVGEPYVMPERAGKDADDVDVAKVERWRLAAFGLGRVAYAVTGPAPAAEAASTAVLRGPEWATAAALAPAPVAGPAVDVFEAASELGAGPVVHVTLDVGTSSAAVATAEALGDPGGPLAARLSELDLPFRLREVTGTANVRGGCVGVVLEAQPSAGGIKDLALRVADAVALVRREASAELEAGARAVDGRTLSRRSGDAREAAELGAWWALASLTEPSDGAGGAGAIALSVPSRRGAKEVATEPSRDALTAAIASATAAWDKPVVEGRSRVEIGQGEVWALLASPCGAEGETDTDSGLTALFTTAATTAARARTTGDVRVEPWVTADGAGVLVHGPAIAGESPVAHARRIADVAARSFAAEPITASALATARAELLRRDARGGSALGVLTSVLAPQHPSWIDAWGSSEPLARSGDATVLLRGQALRSGPLRLAVLANVAPAQAEAAVRAADRWVARRTGDARTCRPIAAAQPPRPGTYAAPPRAGSAPEAYLAFPFPAGDDGAYQAALVVGATLDEPLARLGAEAKVVGWPRAPAFVVRIQQPQAALDASVMQVRSLLAAVHASGPADGDFARGRAARTRAAVASALDPRARVVATWRGEPPGAGARVTPADTRAFAQAHLGEESMVVVAARPPRPPATPTP